MHILKYILLVSVCISTGNFQRVYDERIQDYFLNAIRQKKNKDDMLDYGYSHRNLERQKVNDDGYEAAINKLSDYIERIKEEARHDYGMRKSHVPVYDDVNEAQAEYKNEIDSLQNGFGRNNIVVGDLSGAGGRRYHSGEQVGGGRNSVEEEETVTKTLKMPNVSPQTMDTYLCHAQKLPEDDSYIVQFTPAAKQQIAHHMLLFSCEEPYMNHGKAWNCREMQPVCKTGRQSIMYAWAKGAPSLTLPKGVGFHTGGVSAAKYLVLQVHYLNVTSFQHGKKDSSGLTYKITKQKKQYLAGIYLLADGMTPIPPHKKRAHIDVGCHFPSGSPTIFPFRFRTHAHKLGVVITGYRVRDGKWTIIGRGDPQRPQAFYRVFNDIDIQPGDYVMGRCTYNSMSRNTTTHIGATHKDEMCNFYIMFFYQPGDDEATFGCDYVNTHSEMPYTKYPTDSDVALSVMEARNKNESKGEERFPTFKALYKPVEGWPMNGYRTGDIPLTVGQISGVAYDEKADQIVLFHRGSRVWGWDTFYGNHTLRKKYRTLIGNHTLLWLTRGTGAISKVGGARMFCMPHGITIDHEHNIWVTDVGTHQVFKLSPDLKVLLSLGERFVYGNDSKHFCKPTDVAVMKDGTFFVSDGYCNSRVVKFDKSGKMIGEISTNKSKHIDGLKMNVVHGLALDETHNRLFVADRENERVLVFHPETLDFIKAITHKFAGAVYAVAYNDDRSDGVLHVVNGPLGGRHVRVSGFTYDLETDSVVSMWRPSRGLRMPHDLAVTDDNRDIFVAEIGPNKIWKFRLNQNTRPK